MTCTWRRSRPLGLLAIRTAQLVAEFKKYLALALWRKTTIRCWAESGPSLYCQIILWSLKLPSYRIIPEKKLLNPTCMSGPWQWDFHVANARMKILSRRGNLGVLKECLGQHVRPLFTYQNEIVTLMSFLEILSDNNIAVMAITTPRSISQAC